MRTRATNSDNDVATSRLEFEREQWNTDVELRKQELDLKEREQLRLQKDLELRVVEARRARWSGPLVTAIVVAALAAFGNAYVTRENGEQQLALETTKDESTRISEMIKTGDQKSATNNLKFLLDAGLISNPETVRKINDFLKKNPDQGPFLPSSASSSQKVFHPADWLQPFLQNGFIVGVDLSHYQSGADLKALKQQGVDFVYVKATQGASGAEETASPLAQQASDAGMLVGFYHRVTSEDADAQFANFSTFLSNHHSDLPPSVDFEGQGIGPGVVTKLLAAIENKFHVKPVIYEGAAPPTSDDTSKYPLWVANYPANVTPASQPRLPTGRSAYTFWQFTSSKYLGFDGPLDFNLFKGDMAALRALNNSTN